MTGSLRAGFQGRVVRVVLLVVGFVILGVVLVGCGRAPGGTDPGRVSDLSGVVRDAATGNGIGAAALMLDGEAVSFTDQGGSYAFAGVSPGVHRLSVAAPGYESADVWVEVSPGAVQDIELMPAGSFRPLISLTNVNNSDVNAGEVVSVTVSVRRAKSLAGAAGRVVFDPDAFEWVGYEPGDPGSGGEPDTVYLAEKGPGAGPGVGVVSFAAAKTTGAWNGDATLLTIRLRALKPGVHGLYLLRDGLALEAAGAVNVTSEYAVSARVLQVD